MKKILFLISVLLLILVGSYLYQRDAAYPEFATEALNSAYPQVKFEFYTDAENNTYAQLLGEAILLSPSSGCPSVEINTDSNPPLCATFNFPYPAGPGGRYPEAGFDPGRIRNQTLLMKLYGNSAQAVKGNSVMVDFLGKKVLFNENHGAAAALGRVSKRLEKSLVSDPKLKEYIFPLGGTFDWRVVQNSSRLSPHSFAIAIDLNVDKGIYWLWDYKNKPQLLEQTRKNYPQAIVDAFEAEGFIWGGKWASFDFMHFEYRPEMFVGR